MRRYGSTLMNVTSGWSAATALIFSSVGPQVLVWQNFGVAKTSTNGSFAATSLTLSRVGPQVLVWQNFGVAKTSTNG